MNVRHSRTGVLNCRRRIISHLLIESRRFLNETSGRRRLRWEEGSGREREARKVKKNASPPTSLIALVGIGIILKANTTPQPRFIGASWSHRRHRRRRHCHRRQNHCHRCRRHFQALRIQLQGRAVKSRQTLPLATLDAPKRRSQRKSRLSLNRVRCYPRSAGPASADRRYPRRHHRTELGKDSGALQPSGEREVRHCQRLQRKPAS